MTKLQRPTGFEGLEQKAKTRRALAAAMATQAGSTAPVGSWAQVLAQVLEGYGSKKLERDADKADTEYNDKLTKAYATATDQFNTDAKTLTPEQLQAKYAGNPYVEDLLKPFSEAFTSRLKNAETIENTPQGYQRAGDLVGKGPIADLNKGVIPDLNHPGSWMINPLAVARAQTSQMVPADSASAMALMGMRFNPTTGVTTSGETGAQTTPPYYAPQPDTPGSFTPGNIGQVESGNRDFNPDGSPVTSVKGAMYRMQVMPSTARAPGFGVKPVPADILALDPRDPRRAAAFNQVGTDYAAAMRSRYGGDPAKAAAAYNGGPGRVDRAISQGGNFLRNMPAETQGYVNKFSKAPSGVIDGKPYWLINGVPYDNPEGR